MIGYGIAKSAVHHLTRSLVKDGGLPEEALAVAILPITLDTPMNRKWMPKADFSTWTPLEFVAEYVIASRNRSWKVNFLFFQSVFEMDQKLRKTTKRKFGTTCY